MISDVVVELSQWQFAVTSLYHFLFVPLTIGLSFLLAIMESTYVITGREIYKDMTQFWGTLFGINFALWIASGLMMQFQFGMNWSYFSHYVGDVLGVPLMIAGLIAFFMESTFVGLFFFAWDKLTKGQHLTLTWLLAFCSNLSALWVIVANGWIQNPVGAEFNYETMRMEVSSYIDIFLNPTAQVKFVHTVTASYVTASAFVLGISAYYLLKGRDIAFALRSYATAAGFGLAAIVFVMVLGDGNGYSNGEIQKTKLAAIEAEWRTEPAPASFTVFGFPDQKAKMTHDAVTIPLLYGLIGTWSINTPIIGLNEIMEKNRKRIRNGIVAYGLLQQLREGRKDQWIIDSFEKVKKDLGFGLLLKRYTENVVGATEEQIEQAVVNSIPDVVPIFWAFRIMIFSGVISFIVFLIAVFSGPIQQPRKKWVLHISLFSLPLPWVASEAGWFLTEFGRQPWAIAEVLPVFFSVSSLAESDIIVSFFVYAIVYTFFFGIELFLMMKYIKIGPSSLDKGRYHFELNEGGSF